MRIDGVDQVEIGDDAHDTVLAVDHGEVADAPLHHPGDGIEQIVVLPCHGGGSGHDVAGTCGPGAGGGREPATRLVPEDVPAGDHTEEATCVNDGEATDPVIEH